MTDMATRLAMPACGPSRHGWAPWCGGWEISLLATAGGEFVILMPGNDQTGALYIAQRLCAEVQALGIPHEDNSDAGVVTVSIGAATAWPGEPASASRSIDVLLTTADTALYEAKNTGNQVGVAEVPVAAAASGGRVGTVELSRLGGPALVG